MKGYIEIEMPINCNNCSQLYEHYDKYSNKTHHFCMMHTMRRIIDDIFIRDWSCPIISEKALKERLTEGA